jgi:myo-inositol-1-phosphate synthase
MGKIKVAIAGVGNCASSLVQGVEYYRRHDRDKQIPGLMHNDIAGYRVKDLKFVAAFDIDARKVGEDLNKAIFAKPNCTTVFCRDIPKTGIKVMRGPTLDGLAAHLKHYSREKRFLEDKEHKPVNAAKVLKETRADVLVNYMPVGSQEATEYYANACLKSRTAFVNCMPVFIASNDRWATKFEKAKIPVVGDDIKSQVGATIVHRVLTRLFRDRGVIVDRTYQLNVGGNTDFLNMLDRARLTSKKISKTSSVQSQLDEPLAPDNIHIGPSDYVPFLKDNKLAFIRLEGREFGDVPLNVELRLSVEDSPNSGGSSIDAIRCAKLALDRKIAGPLISISAYTMKHPPEQFTDPVARQMVEEFIAERRER